MGFCVEFASFLCLLTYANTQSSLPKLFTQSTSFIFQNLDYLTKHETKSEKLELDESTRQKLHKIISEPDIEADIAWIEVSNLLKKFIAFFLKKNLISASHQKPLRQSFHPYPHRSNSGSLYGKDHRRVIPAEQDQVGEVLATSYALPRIT